MFERFADGARNAVTGAERHARALNHGWIGTEHLLLGLLDESDGRGARLRDVQRLEALHERAQRGDGPQPDGRVGAVDRLGQLHGVLCTHTVNIR